MNKFFKISMLISGLYANLHSKIIHEQIPFFVPDHPVIFDVNFSREQIDKAEIYYSTSSRKGNNVMQCNNFACVTILQTFITDMYIEYIIRIRLKSGEEFETPVLVVNKLTIPEWQIGENLSNFETIEASNVQNPIEGFSLNGFAIMDKNQAMQNKNNNDNLEENYDLKLKRQDNSSPISFDKENKFNNREWWKFWYRNEKETP